MACRIFKVIVRETSCQTVRTDSKNPEALWSLCFLPRTASPEGLEEVETARNCVVGASDLSHLENQRSGIGTSDSVQHVRFFGPTKTLGSLVLIDPCVLCDRGAPIQRTGLSGGCS